VVQASPETALPREVVDKEWEVEKIIKHKISRFGQLLYEIKWKNFPMSQNTWEPEENLKGAKEAMEEYYGRLGGRREELRVRLEALRQRIKRDRKLPLTHLKWLFRELCGKQSPYEMTPRVRESLHRDIAEITSYTKATEFANRVLENFDQLFKKVRGSSTGTPGAVKSKVSGPSPDEIGRRERSRKGG
jgi:hypothetical protein